MANPPNTWIISIPEGRTDEFDAVPDRRDWANPGIDILETILGRLGPVANLKFGGVCRSWRALRFAVRAPRTPQLPLLMHPSFSFNHRRSFLDPADGRRYKFPLSELFAETCLGSSGSWLVMRGYSFHLFNPFSLQKVRLPYIEEDPLEQAFSYKVPLIVLSKPDTEDFAAILFYQQCFYFLRHGHERWTSCGFYNAHSHGKIIQASAVDGTFYALTSLGRLAHIDLNRSPVLVWADHSGNVEFDKANEHPYLLEVNAKLVVVITKCQRRRNEFVVAQETIRIRAMDPVTCTWSDARYLLADRLFFLGQKGSMSVECDDRARVYTAGDGVFGLLELDCGDRASGRGSTCCVHHNRSTGVWVMPEFLFRDRKQKWWVGLYAIVSEKMILILIFGLVVFEMLLLALPHSLVRLFPPFMMDCIENLLVWGPVWISFCIACNCICRTLGR